MMMPEIEKQFAQLELQRAALMQRLSEMSDAQLSFQPAADRWSIIHVLQHLAAAEEGTLRYLRKKSQAESLPRAGMGCALRSALLTLVLRSPFRFRAPQGLELPKEDQTLAEVAKKWEHTRQEMQRFLETLPPDRATAQIFRHPFAGYFNIFHTLRFFREHIKHHEKQIKRIQNSPHFPR